MTMKMRDLNTWIIIGMCCLILMNVEEWTNACGSTMSEECDADLECPL